PTAAPTIEVSEIGVSSTRSTPNSSGRPLNCPKTPPWSAMSSPIANTSGSRRISSRMAAMVASVKVMSGMGRPHPLPPSPLRWRGGTGLPDLSWSTCWGGSWKRGGVEVVEGRLGLGQRALTAELDGRRQLLLDLGLEPRQGLLVEQPLGQQAPPES